MTRSSCGLQQKMLSSCCTKQKHAISRHGVLCFEHYKAAPHKPFRAQNLPVLPMCSKLPLSSHRLCCGNSHLSHQQSCSAVRQDHLAALATLSDQDFADFLEGARGTFSKNVGGTKNSVVCTKGRCKPWPPPSPPLHYYPGFTAESTASSLLVTHQAAWQRHALTMQEVRWCDLAADTAADVNILAICATGEHLQGSHFSCWLSKLCPCLQPLYLTSLGCSWLKNKQPCQMYTR
ncbi:hypothetical protein WJX82_003369 [Trebouxia sp. C0006]